MGSPSALASVRRCHDVSLLEFRGYRDTEWGGSTLSGVDDIARVAHRLGFDNGNIVSSPLSKHSFRWLLISLC